jgi:TPP-dependent pyruvate/acetoin dehydrogenase alpha subunit
MSTRELGALADPTRFHDRIDVSGEDAAGLKAALRSMLRIRMAEQHLAAQRRDGLIGGPVHLGVGQEAAAVGVSMHLTPRDRVFGAHRSHSHLLALGSSIHGLFAEVLGKDTGHSRGMGGSMHLWDESRGFCGSVPIVAGTVSLAVGAGLAAQLKGTNTIAVAYFGDGAAEEGVVHESLNLAAVFRMPVLFVVENNLFSSHMHISLRQPANSIARFADAHAIPSAVVDGNDVVAVARATGKLVDAARAGAGPGFIEAVTARWYGHVDWREDIDVGVNRSQADLQNWRGRDPIRRLREGLAQRGWWSDAEQVALENALRAEIDEAWERAMADPYPEASALLDRVYAPRKPRP